MKNFSKTMEYNPTPGGIDMHSVLLAGTGLLLKAGTIFLDAPAGLSITATIVAILACVTTIIYNIIKIKQEVKSKK